jgi:hypothetical protein
MTTSSSKTVYLQQSRDHATNKYRYMVVKLNNTTDPAIGEVLEKKEVDDLLRRKYKVNIS